MHPQSEIFKETCGDKSLARLLKGCVHRFVVTCLSLFAKLTTIKLINTSFLPFLFQEVRFFVFFLQKNRCNFTNLQGLERVGGQLNNPLFCFLR